MMFYIPTSFEERDYRPSWTGNNTYPTATIRGIFDSEIKAKIALKNWHCLDDYEILEHWIEDDELPENLNEISFDIYLEDTYLYIYANDNGEYKLNEVVDEEWSVVYDEEGALGVTDY